MADSPPCMVSVPEASQKAARRFDRDSRSWAALLFRQEIGQCADGEPVRCSISLHPPTERRVLNNPGAARAWAQSWRACPWTDAILWEKREWGSAGPQTVPVRLVLEDPDAIARCANRSEQWNTLVLRSKQLADRWSNRWSEMCPDAQADVLVAAVQSSVGKCCELEERDWSIVLGALDWLVGHPDATPYIRQLPIRGIDTKWMERHRAVVDPLRRAMIGRNPCFCKQSTQFRMRALDVRLALGGLTEVSVSAAQLDRCTHRPDVVIVCENLVNVLAMPSIEGAFAIHGSGYAVKDFREVSWFASTPILYWGDLDSNGFAILNQFRCYFDHVNSVMMDEATLDRHYDLCVEEPKPNTGTLSYLKESEQAALARLLAGDANQGFGAIRLEQERIEWPWACNQLQKHLLPLDTVQR